MKSLEKGAQKGNIQEWLTEIAIIMETGLDARELWWNEDILWVHFITTTLGLIYK